MYYLFKCITGCHFNAAFEWDSSCSQFGYTHYTDSQRFVMIICEKKWSQQITSWDTKSSFVPWWFKHMFALYCSDSLAEYSKDFFLLSKSSRACEVPFFPPFSFTCQLLLLFFTAASFSSESFFFSSVLRPSAVCKSSPSLSFFSFLLLSFAFFSSVQPTHWLLSSGWWYCELVGGKGCSSTLKKQWIFPVVCLSPSSSLFLCSPPTHHPAFFFLSKVIWGSLERRSFF